MTSRAQTSERERLIRIAEIKAVDDYTDYAGYGQFSKDVAAMLRADAEKIRALEAAGQRALNWLASYPGNGAIGAYDEMRKALAQSPRSEAGEGI